LRPCAAYRLKLLYTYQNGQLLNIKDFNAQTTVFWSANTANARGQFTQQTLGNGVITNRTYDAVTGWLGSQTSGVGGGTGVQNEGTLYDLMGNVTQRQNNASSLTENFYYDNLYRLDYSTLKVGAGSPTTNLDVAYDATGNITTKSDVGAYNYTTPQSGCSYYANTQKHAVRLAGSTVYCYDANGNMVRRGVAANTISWTSYNYPSTITSGTETVSFLYGAERQRWRTQLTSGGVTETTYHVGREFQKVQTASTDYRHYITVGNRSVAIYSRLSTGTNTLRYVLEDHQGSATNLLSSTGTSLVKENFSAFGNRRNPATWSGAPSAADLTAINGITREGYTWQTALGAMGLNHMNGRVQDSLSGRFLSPDPNIPDPMNTGDYNRYSYVNSNPMTFTDPTGFCIWDNDYEHWCDQTYGWLNNPILWYDPYYWGGGSTAPLTPVANGPTGVDPAPPRWNNPARYNETGLCPRGVSCTGQVLKRYNQTLTGSVSVRCHAVPNGADLSCSAAMRALNDAFNASTQSGYGLSVTFQEATDSYADLDIDITNTARGEIGNYACAETKGSQVTVLGGNGSCGLNLGTFQHEAGHFFGLIHNPTPGSVMNVGQFVDRAYNFSPAEIETLVESYDPEPFVWFDINVW
jgi:RHS repeat-associated protein